MRQTLMRLDVDFLIGTGSAYDVSAGLERLAEIAPVAVGFGDLLAVVGVAALSYAFRLGRANPPFSF